MLYNPETYKRKKKRSGMPWFYVLIVACLVGVGFWKGEEMYYQYVGNKGSKMRAFLERFYSRLNKADTSTGEISEPILKGAEFVRKMVKTDQANPEVHYFRAEFQYLIARYEMRLAEPSVLEFAARPNHFVLGERASKLIQFARRAALKSLALDDAHEDHLYARYIAGFGYLFGPAEFRTRSFPYYQKLLSVNFQAGPDEKYHELYWPVMLSAMFSGEEGMAIDAVGRTKILKRKVAKQFMRALILFHAGRYTDSLLSWEQVIARLKETPEGKGPDRFLLKEAYRYSGRIYYRQNLKKKGEKAYRAALALDNKDPVLRKEMAGRGLLKKNPAG